MCKIPSKFGPVTQTKNLGNTRLVYRTDQGILKCCATTKDVEQESSALCLALQLLGDQIKVPKLVDSEDTWILMEDVGSKALSKDSDIRKAAKYIAQIHNFELDGAIRSDLADKRHCHYTKSSLDNRLPEEVTHAEKAGFDGRIVDEFRNRVEDVVKYPLPQFSDVLGHGDPQLSNFVVDDEGIVSAIDWHDFGLSNRWYEIAHFLHSIKPDDQDEAVSTYRMNVQLKENLDWGLSLEYGRAVDWIIRAGSVARTKTAEQESASDEFASCVRSLEDVASSLLQR